MSLVNRFVVVVVVLGLIGGALAPAAAQQVTLRLHQFLPAQAPVPKNFLVPWAKKVEEDSKGRIKVELYPSMQLGGTPAQLFDQCKDGVVDIMNKAKYTSLPPDLKKVIDDNSGINTAKWVGQVMDAGDAPGLEIAKKRGNAIVVLDAKETARWKEAAQKVTEAWIAEMKSKGIDGQALVNDVRALVAKYAGPAD